MKLQMVDLSIAQQDLQQQQKQLQADISQLEAQLQAEQDLELKAAENEDFEEAERLNLKISQIKQLILSKQALTKNNEDDLAGIENRKGDK